MHNSFTGIFLEFKQINIIFFWMFYLKEGWFWHFIKTWLLDDLQKHNAQILNVNSYINLYSLAKSTITKTSVSRTSIIR